jgi:hypothetical protein
MFSRFLSVLKGRITVRVPPRARVIPCSGAFRPLSVNKLWCGGPFGAFSLVAGCPLACFADRQFVVRYLFMDVPSQSNMRWEVSDLVFFSVHAIPAG